MSSTPVIEVLRRVNRSLALEILRLRESSNVPNLSTLSVVLRQGKDCIEALQKGEAGPSIEIDAYRTCLQELQDLLPRLRTRLLVDQRRMEQVRQQLHVVRNWADSAGSFL